MSVPRLLRRSEALTCRARIDAFHNRLRFLSTTSVSIPDLSPPPLPFGKPFDLTSPQQLSNAAESARARPTAIVHDGEVSNPVGTKSATKRKAKTAESATEKVKKTRASKTKAPVVEAAGKPEKAKKTRASDKKTLSEGDDVVVRPAKSSTATVTEKPKRKTSSTKKAKDATTKSATALPVLHGSQLATTPQEIESEVRATSAEVEVSTPADLAIETMATEPEMSVAGVETLPLRRAANISDSETIASERETMVTELDATAEATETKKAEPMLTAEEPETSSTATAHANSVTASGTTVAADDAAPPTIVHLAAPLESSETKAHPSHQLENVQVAPVDQPIATEFVQAATPPTTTLALTATAPDARSVTITSDPPSGATETSVSTSYISAPTISKSELPDTPVPRLQWNGQPAPSPDTDSQDTKSRRRRRRTVFRSVMAFLVAVPAVLIGTPLAWEYAQAGTGVDAGAEWTWAGLLGTWRAHGPLTQVGPKVVLDAAAATTAGKTVVPEATVAATSATVTATAGGDIGAANGADVPVV